MQKRLPLDAVGSKIISKDTQDYTWKIKTYNMMHTCLKEMKNRCITSKWFAYHYLHKFSDDKHYSISSLQQDVRTDSNTLVSLTKCHRTELVALQIVLGSAKEQYGKIYDYLEEVRQTNRGTTIVFSWTTDYS